MDLLSVPKAGRHKAKVKKPYTSLQLLEVVLTFLEERKAIDLLALPLEGKSSIADYLVICSGSSQRHISSMAEDLALLLKSEWAVNPAVEGASQSDWVLLDAGDIIIHLFRPEVRTFYNLEKMWDFSAQTVPEVEVAG